MIVGSDDDVTEGSTLLNLLTDEVRRNPYPLYDRFRSSSPVLHDADSGLWMIFDYEGVSRLLTDH